MKTYIPIDTVVLVNCIRSVRVGASKYYRRARDRFCNTSLTIRFLWNPFEIERAASIVAFKTYFWIFYAWWRWRRYNLEMRNKTERSKSETAARIERTQIEQKLDENKITRNETKLPKLTV